MDPERFETYINTMIAGAAGTDISPEKIKQLCIMRDKARKAMRVSDISERLDQNT